MDFEQEKITLDVYIEELDVSENADLRISENKICLWVYNSYGAELVARMTNWLNKLDWSRFGKFVKCANAFKGKDCISVDLSDSRLMTFGCVENETFVFGLSVIQYSCKCEKNENFAEFILNDAGYMFIQTYYSSHLERREGQTVVMQKRENIPAHVVMEAKCFPKFFFKSTNGTKERELKIEKVPILKWSDFVDVKLVKEYNSWVCLLASLFYHQDVDYVKGVICLNGTKTIIKKIIAPKPYVKDHIFLHFNGLNKVFLFLDNISFEVFKEQKSFLISVIERYLQSTMLVGATKYLMLYNVLEQCQEKAAIEKFKKSKTIRRKCIELLDQVLPYVLSEEQDDFKRRWNSVWYFLQQKPYKGGVSDFLMKNNIDVNKMNLCLKDELRETSYDIVTLRNNIAHGGNINVTNGINDMLSFVDLVLILKKLKCNITINNILKYSNILISESCTV